MANFCMECGSKSDHNARSCSSCGEPFIKVKSISKGRVDKKFIMEGDEDFYIEDDGTYDFSSLAELLEQEVDRYNGNGKNKK